MLTRRTVRAALPLTRSLAWYHLMDPEKAAQRRAKLSEDLKKGQWGDVVELRENGGKTEPTYQRLTPAESAPVFCPPGFDLVDANGEPTAIPTAPVNVVGVVFVEGAKIALRTWTAHIAAAPLPPATHTLLSVVDSRLFSLPGLKNLIFRAGRSAPATDGYPIYHFGELWPFILRESSRLSLGSAEPLRSAQRLPNRLAAYVFLLDSAGRVRWRGSGVASDEERRWMDDNIRALNAEGK